MVNSKTKYARFWKCALQVNPHTYQEKYQGKSHGLNAGSYAEELLKVCEEENVNIVGLADHGNVNDYRNIRERLTDGGIVVFPGFEITTTEKVHWVILFPETTEENDLNRYLGRLGLTDSNEKVFPSSHSGSELLKTVEELGGFCYAAHVTSRSGLLKERQYPLWRNSDLRVAQIPGQIDDLPMKFKEIVQNKTREYHRKNQIALINANDVATPEDLRKSGTSTFIKMTEPSFDSFLMAFKDPESRIRLGEGIEQQYYSQIHSISIEGGYFDGLSAKISGHLNTIIGGRGTGKTTFLECIRYALDSDHKGTEAIKQGEQIIRENLGNAGGTVTLELSSSANNMKRYTVTRRYGEPPRVIDENGDVSHLHPSKDLLPSIEIYGQNEIYEVTKSGDALARILDRFLPDNDRFESQLKEVYQRLKENGTKLVELRKKKDEVEQKVNQLPLLKEKVQQIKNLGLEEKLQQVPLLEKQKQLIELVKNEVERTSNGQKGMEDSLPDLVFLSEKSIELLPSKKLLIKARRVLETLKESLQKRFDEINKDIKRAKENLNPVYEEFENTMKRKEGLLVKEFSNLPSIAGKEGKEVGFEYKNLLQEIERIKPIEIQLKKSETLIEELEQERRNLRNEISNFRKERTLAKQRKASDLNDLLSGKLKITVIPNGLRQPLRDYLQSLPGVGPSSTEWVEEATDLTILGLSDAIFNQNETLQNRSWGLTKGFAEKLSKLSREECYKLETIDLQDKINLELNVSQEREIYKPLSNLSTGQQCTAILHLLLLENKDPLIMDQPEDNLDNAFVANRIVKELRSTKTKRQFLFATHNANIPVFGDAEWIGVCAVSGNQAEMPEEVQGSIDISAIRDQVTSILEGGEEAFIQRKEKYGFE